MKGGRGRVEGMAWGHSGPKLVSKAGQYRAIEWFPLDVNLHFYGPPKKVEKDKIWEPFLGTALYGHP